MRTMWSVLSTERTTVADSPSQTDSTIVSSIRRTRSFMYGSAAATIGRPARAAEASVSTWGPSEYSEVRSSYRSRFAARSAFV